MVNMTRPPTSSLLAFMAAVVAAATSVWSAASARDVAIVVGGPLVLPLPYLLIALALARRSVLSKGLGVGMAGLMTWLTSFALTEAVLDLQRGDPVRASSLPFIVLTVLGLATLGFGLRALARAVHATGYWTWTPVAARLAMLAFGYWVVVFVADTYLTANPPLGRMLLAPSLLVIDLGAALMLRAPLPAARAAGVLLAAAACGATAIYWIAYAPYLTPSGHPPAIPDLGYRTRLPWPPVLAVSLALNAAAALAGARHLLSRSTGP
jgi:hypothetical protein